MALNPSYGPGVEDQLDEVEDDAERSVLWRSVTDTLYSICEQPDLPKNRRYALTTPSGQMIWRVPIPSGQETENYSVLWAEDEKENEAVFLYVGVWPPNQRTAQLVPPPRTPR